jgi:alpha-galactosidase
MLSAVSFAILFAGLLSSCLGRAQALQLPWDGLAPTPPMGWASWNHFFCDYNDQTIREQADALVSSGMRDVGYKYVIIQECIASNRDAKGSLILDSKRFPNGMKALVDYVHSRGLKAGIYTDVGKYTCFPNPRYEGSYEHVDQDAATFASWGMDLVEMDYCNLPEGHTGREIYERMAKSIQATGRPMLFYICSWGNEKPWEWAQGTAQLWRTERDISYDRDKVDWNQIVLNFESNATHAVFSAPNSWNDPDMIEVGNHGLNEAEAQTHFNMWVISSAPLWSGADLTHLTPLDREIYTNREAIAIDQDSLGEQALGIQGYAPGLEIWAKPLQAKSSGKVAVLLMNLTDKVGTLKLRWSDLNLSGEVSVRDVIKHQDLGQFPINYMAQIEPHASVLLRASGKFAWTRGLTYEAEWPGNIKAGKVSIIKCGECSRAYAMALNGGNNGEESSLTFRHVDVDQAGKYKLDVVFVQNGIDKKTVRLLVNSKNPVDLVLPVDMYASVQVPIELNKGSNTIAVKFSGKGVVYLDQVKLHP